MTLKSVVRLSDEHKQILAAIAENPHCAPPETSLESPGSEDSAENWHEPLDVDQKEPGSREP